MIFGVYLNTFICMTNRHIFQFLIGLVVYINVTPCTLPLNFGTLGQNL